MYLQRASIYLSLERVSSSIIKEHQQMHHQSESIDLLLESVNRGNSRERQQLYHQIESIIRCITKEGQQIYYQKASIDVSLRVHICSYAITHVYVYLSFYVIYRLTHSEYSLVSILGTILAALIMTSQTLVSTLVNPANSGSNLM